MSFATVHRPLSLVLEVGQRLARELLRPGAAEWLPPERVLAERLGVSRTVIREATKRLELQGLVEVRHGVGIRRSNRLHQPLNGSLELLIPDAADRLRQSLEVRLTIEPEIARLAAERATASQLAALRQSHARLAAAPSLSDAVEEDVAFHRALAEASGNGVFALVLETLADVGRESRKATIEFAGARRAVEHHTRILDAVERRDGDAAAKAMREHIEIAMKDLRRDAAPAPPRTNGKTKSRKPR